MTDHVALAELSVMMMICWDVACCSDATSVDNVLAVLGHTGVLICIRLTNILMCVCAFNSRDFTALCARDTLMSILLICRTAVWMCLIIILLLP